jgi:hypothetical protein
VKTFFNISTPVTGSSTESSTQSLVFLVMAVNGIAGREEGKKPAHMSYKAKLE